MQEQLCPTLGVSSSVIEGWGTSSESQSVLGDPQVAPESPPGSVLEHPKGEDGLGDSSEVPPEWERLVQGSDTLLHRS